MLSFQKDFWMWGKNAPIYSKFHKYPGENSRTPWCIPRTPDPKRFNSHTSPLRCRMYAIGTDSWITINEEQLLSGEYSSSKYSSIKVLKLS